MQHTLTISQLKKYAGIPSDFSLSLIEPHIETAFRKKIFPYISSSMLTDLIASTDNAEKEIAELILKSAANYAVIISIPFIKVKFNSAGIDQYEQEKMKTAPWWDVRDLGLAMVKIADEALSDALTLIGKIPALKAQCDFFTEFSFTPIPTPEEFNKIYTINKSMDVYNLLVPLMKRMWQFTILAKIKDCTIAELQAKPELLSLLKDSLAYFSLAYALRLSQFTFITSGVVVQYEELPWQKSLVLDDRSKANLETEFMNIGNDALGSILQYLKDHPEEFPCYKPITQETNRKIIEKESGLYL